MKRKELIIKLANSFGILLIVFFTARFAVSFVARANGLEPKPGASTSETVHDESYYENFDGKISSNSGSITGNTEILRVGIVKGEKIINEEIKSELKSENFAIKQMSFGSDSAILSSDENKENILPIMITDIRSESLTAKSKNKEESKILISWKTNKLAISEISYSINGSADTKKISEDHYGYEHSAVLANLEQGLAYVYTIKATDRWGNEITSDRYAAYSGSKTISVFELISKALGDTFGWAVKK